MRLRRLNQRGFRVRIADRAQRGAILVKNTTPAALTKLVEAHKQHVRVSLPLPDKRWLNIRGRVIEHQWLLFGFILTTIILVAALVLLCYWAVQHLALPLGQLVDAAKRFGMDVQAPPLAESGTAEMQEFSRAFNQMQGRIRRLLHDRTTMLAAISHDLRTPITRLQLRTEYLKGTPQYEKAVADLEDMERMITSILAFARDHTRSEAAERFDINALLESTCNDFCDAGHQVVYHGLDQRVAFYGRLSAIRRVITNIIENAIKYGECAEVYLFLKSDTLQIRVDDNGPGISQAELEKVFEPFYRVDPSRSPKTGGVGLGMAVARDIVTAHGGEIQLINREPSGLSVLITLPIKSE